MIRDTAPVLGLSASDYIKIAQDNIFISSASIESHEQLCSELYQMHLSGIRVVFIDTLGKLQEAMQWLRERQIDRAKRNVVGTYKK
jgi:hypothetical protein